MDRKIFLLTLAVLCNGALAQLPTGLPPNFASNGIPPLPGIPGSDGIPSFSGNDGKPPTLPASGGLPSFPSASGIPALPPNGGLPSFPFPGILNPTNWNRPSLSSTSEIWQKYFKQLQAARKELLQSLNNYQNSNQTGSEIKPRNVKIPTSPPFLSGQSFTLLPQIENAVSQFINQARPSPPNGRPQRLFPGNNPLRVLLPAGLIPQFGNNNNSG